MRSTRRRAPSVSTLLDSAQHRSDNVGMSSGGFEPGWYPSPGEPGVLRRWDGTQWTEGRCVPMPRPPRRTRSWSIGLAIVLPIVAVVGLIGSFALYVRSSGEAHDHFALDDPTIRNTATSACLVLSSVLERSTGADADAIRAGNEGISELVVTMNGIDRNTLEEDEPALDWIADWEQLAVQREAFAEALEDGREAVFEIPQTADEYPISKRMADVAPIECDRAVQRAIDL